MADNNQKQADMSFTSFSMSRESIENFEFKVASENDGLQKCDKCDYKTSKAALMYDHILVRHSKVKHKCTECDYQHHFLNRVGTHFKQVHMGIPRGGRSCKRIKCPNFGTTLCLFLEDHVSYQCEQCNFSARSSRGLNLHVQSVHEGIAFTCEFCQKSFVERRGLKYHVQSVHEGIKFTCEFCQKSYVEKKKLQRHIKEDHHETSLTCSQCCKFTGSSSNMRYHMQNVHESTMLICKFCQKSYTDKKRLKCHIKEVHEQILLNCSRCKYTGISKNMKQHIQGVHDKITYPCNECNLNFTRKYTLNCHIKKIHQEI